MAQRITRLGRPRKYCDEWVKCNTKIYFSKEMLEKWRELQILDFANGRLPELKLTISQSINQSQ